jgi:ABC-type antimicrobial peptide transport system permease subunit
MLQDRLIAALAGAFGVIALILATIGLYGVMSYVAATRTREIGIRLALGAQPSRVIGSLVREAMLLVGAGIALGVPAALASTKLVSSWLFGLKPNDPVTIVSGALFLASVGMVAAYIPAKRAAGVDPLVALRHD